jgi:predicted membrane-bound spermidine synthase
MASPETDQRPRLSFALLAVCFFGSGLTALVYELLWTRRLHLTFGSTTYSVTTVLAAFMAGLGLGAYFIGRRVDRRKLDGVRVYAYLELAVGLYALASLPLLAAVEWVYAQLQSWLQLSQEPAAVLKLVLAFPVLAFPAALMGGTLPALVRGLLRSRATLHSTVGRLYGINTAGAAAGTAVCGMVMVELLGLWRSMLLSALVNLAIGVTVLSRLGRQRRSEGDDAPASEAPTIRLRQHLRSRPVLFCIIAVIFTGLLSMLYEIIWTRMLSLVMGSSTYAFTIVLSIFLVGIAFGALIYARASRGRPPTAFGLTLVLLALALWVVISLVVIPFIPNLLVNLAQIPGINFYRILSFEAMFAVFILLVPTLLLGAALPMSMGIISRTIGNVGQDVGGVYLINTLGAITGSVLTGFLLIPLIGTQNTLLGGLMANLLLVGFGVLSFAGKARLKLLGSIVVLLMAGVALSQPRWPPIVFDSGLGYRLDQTVATDKLDMIRALYRTPNKLLFREEGRNATITVRHFSRGVSLLVNGKPDASTSGDMLTQVVLGVVATMAHPRPRDVAVVGWGSGVTTYTITLFPEVRRVDTIEIEPAVLRASPFFHGVNGKAELSPKVGVIFDDARSHFLTSDREYDVVISEPSNPWMVGVSGLFSRDYYQLAKRRLRPGGVFGQWLQLYRIDARSVALILRTVLDSFQHVQVWASDPFNVILIGSDRPLTFDIARTRAAYRRSKLLRQHMAVYGPGVQAEHLYGCFLLDTTGLKRIIKRFPQEVMTDDRPVLEYRAVRNLYAHVHRHIDGLWRAKFQLRQEVPARSGAPPGLALAGAADLYRNIPKLSARITRWGMKRHSAEPQLRLARAKALVRLRRRAAARKLLETLPQDHPGYRAEAALLDARVMLKEDRPLDALRRLDDMKQFRPTAKLIYLMRGSMQAGRFDLAWTFAEDLVRRLNDPVWDLDVQRMFRGRFYSEVQLLMNRSKRYGRAIRLLNKRREPFDGETDRLWALANAYWRARRWKKAAQTMDQILDYNASDSGTLELCTKVYRKVKDEQRARACERLLRLADAKPAGQPLWD